MTREEAIHLLGVSDSSTDQDIQKKYNDLYNDYQIRLTNAPTPNLKKLYQKNLQELNEAVNLLLKSETAGILKDLPSSAPVFESGEQQQNTPSQPQTTYGSQNIATNSSKKNQPAPKSTSKGVYIFGVLCVILLSVAILLFIFFNENKQIVAEQENSIAVLRAHSDSVSILLNDYTSKFSNGLMQIKNEGSEPLNVTWLIVSYRNETGGFTKLEKWMDVTIRAGGSEKLQVVEGSKVTWDGSVISYAFGINYAGREIFQSGIWSNDAVDGALVFNLDQKD